MEFEFAVLKLPEIESRIKGREYERLKRSLVALLLAQRAKTFSDEASAQGAWTPLSMKHADSRASDVFSKVSPSRLADLQERGIGLFKILQDTGLLRGSFTNNRTGTRGGEGKTYLTEESQGDEVSISTSVPYAAIQNFGGTVQIPEIRNGFGRGVVIPAHQVTIPARPFDQFTEDNQREIAELIDHFLNSGDAA